MKTITIKLAMGKSPVIESHGFAGVGCKDATAVFERALGKVTEVTPKMAMYQAEVTPAVNQTLGGVE